MLRCKRISVVAICYLCCLFRFSHLFRFSFLSCFLLQGFGFLPFLLNSYLFCSSSSMSLSNSSPSTSSPTNSHSPMQSLVGGMSGIWSYVVRLSNSPLDENEETPFNARAKIRLELRGFQYKKIISNLGIWNLLTIKL